MTKKAPRLIAELGASPEKWRLPTLPRVCSTIGASRLNFSVRNGKRWDPAAITALMGDMNGKKLTASLIWTLEHLEFLEHLEYLELLELTTTSLSSDNPKRT